MNSSSFHAEDGEEEKKGKKKKEEKERPCEVQTFMVNGFPNS